MELVKGRAETQMEEVGFERRFLSTPKLPSMGKERGGDLDFPPSCSAGGCVDVFVPPDIWLRLAVQAPEAGVCESPQTLSASLKEGT